MLWENDPTIDCIKPQAENKEKIWKYIGEGREILMKTTEKKIESKTTGIVNTKWKTDSFSSNNKIFYEDKWHKIVSMKEKTITLNISGTDTEIDIESCRKRIPVEILICFNSLQTVCKMELGPCDDLLEIGKKLGKKYGLKSVIANWYADGKEIIDSNQDQLCNLKLNSKLICTISTGIMKVFKRFKNVSSGSWYMSRSSSDSIKFQPLKRVGIYGFGMYCVKEGPGTYTLKYELSLDSDMVKSDSVKIIKEDSENNIVRIFFEYNKTPIFVGKGQMISICIKYAEYDESSRIYSGNDGDENPKVEGNEEDVFLVKSHSDSGNGTGVNSGQIPELYYTSGSKGYKFLRR